MKSRQWAAVAALLLLAGCDTMGGLMGNISTTSQTSNNYRSSAYAAAGTNRDMWVIVTGSVPGADANALQQQTLATMQRHAGITTRFTATPQTHRREYKTVIVFNGPGNIEASELCRNPGQQSATAVAGSELRLQAVFCSNDQFLSEVYARAAGGNSLSNPNFDALIRQTMTDMYAASRESQKDEPGT